MNFRTYRACGTLKLIIAMLLISGCGGGSSAVAPPIPPPPTASANANLAALSINAADLNPQFSAGQSNYVSSTPMTVTSVTVVPTTADANASVSVNGLLVASGSASAPIRLVQGANIVSVTVTAENGTTAQTYTVTVTRETAVAFAQRAYIKASNTGLGDNFGSAVSLSGDGSTMVVGAYREDSVATGANGEQSDDSLQDAGAAYVFVRDAAGDWSQQAYLKASNTGFTDQFGESLSISEGGDTIAVGAPNEASSASGVNGDQSDNTATQAGAVYVFTRDSGGVWTQQAYLKASNPDPGDRFGTSVSLSSDGNRLAVGARGERSSATGVGGDQNDQSMINAGAAYVFNRDSGGGWIQEAYIKASNTDFDDEFGGSLAVSGDGTTLVVGAQRESSNGQNVDADGANNLLQKSGAAYVFVRSPQGVWAQEAFVKAPNSGFDDRFGSTVAISFDGSVVAVGALWERSDANGVDNDGFNDNRPLSGAAYIFRRDEISGWAHEAYFKASNPDENDQFGISVAVSGDGNVLLVGASREQSSASGVNGDQSLNNAQDAGAAYVFSRSVGGSWTQLAYLKASNTSTFQSFYTVAISSDGSTTAIGAEQERSASTGVNGDQTDDGLSFAGALYVFQ